MRSFPAQYGHHHATGDTGEEAHNDGPDIGQAKLDGQLCGDHGVQPQGERIQQDESPALHRDPAPDHEDQDHGRQDGDHVPGGAQGQGRKIPEQEIAGQSAADTEEECEDGDPHNVVGGPARRAADNSTGDSPDKGGDQGQPQGSVRGDIG